MKSEAPVAGTVFVAAFEALPVIAKQYRARRQQGRSLCRPVLERAVCHGGDANVLVSFLEWPVARSIGADDVAYTPTWA
jgi:hypothetical protein